MKRILLLVCLCLPGFVSAQTSAVPGLMSYQGRVSDSGGALIGAAGPVSRSIAFRVWNHPTATTAANRLWSEQQTVTIANGEFSVLIGAGTPIQGETNAAANFGDIFSGSTCFLGVTLDDGNAGTVDPEISPRQQMVATPFSFRARVAEAVANGAVNSTMLANNAVTTTQLADVAVTTSKLANGAITPAQLAPSAVTTAALAPNAVDGTRIAPGAVALAHLAANSVDGTKIAAGSIALSNLGTNSVDSTKLVDGSVALADHAPNSVDGGKIVDGSVGLADHAPNSVDGSKIVDGSVGLADLAANSVDMSKIAPNSVGLNQLDATARAGLPKARHIYTQAIYPTKLSDNNWELIPIDLHELGNDIDGCQMQIVTQHKAIPNDWRISDVTIHLTQPNFTTDPNFPNLIYGRARWVNEDHVGWSQFRLGLATVGDGWNFLGDQPTGWVRIYTYYPGSLRPNNAAPFNQNQNNNASNADANGPDIGLAITSTQAAAGKLIFTTVHPHALQVGNPVVLAGISGPVNPNNPGHSPSRTVSAINDRSSFEVNVPGVTAGSFYSGGSVVYRPTYNKYRVWAAVHPHVSSRIIVSDR